MTIALLKCPAPNLSSSVPQAVSATSHIDATAHSTALTPTNAASSVQSGASEHAVLSERGITDGRDASIIAADNHSMHTTTRGANHSLSQTATRRFRGVEGSTTRDASPTQHHSLPKGMTSFDDVYKQWHVGIGGQPPLKLYAQANALDQPWVKSAALDTQVSYRRLVVAEMDRLQTDLSAGSSVAEEMTRKYGTFSECMETVAAVQAPSSRGSTSSWSTSQGRSHRSS